MSMTHHAASQGTIAMPFTGPAAGIGDLSRHDLSDDENIRDARHQLLRAKTEADFAAWARTWGEVALDRLMNTEAYDSNSYIPVEEHTDVEADLEHADKMLEDLQLATTKAVSDIDAALAGSKGPKTDAIGAITSKLEEAIEASKEERE